jgi:hypothetical protein
MKSCLLRLISLQATRKVEVGCKPLHTPETLIGYTARRHFVACSSSSLSSFFFKPFAFKGLITLLPIFLPSADSNFSSTIIPTIDSTFLYLQRGYFIQKPCALFDRIMFFYSIFVLSLFMHKTFGILLFFRLKKITKCDQLNCVPTIATILKSRKMSANCIIIRSLRIAKLLSN